VSEVKRGQKRIFTGIVRDITERKRAERQLRDYSERLEEMVDERTRELREAQERLLEQQRLEQEVQLAAEIQASLLPEHVPSLEGFEFAATALPARHVSGDLYDFILPAPDGECCHIVLADIAGKGIPAALLTSTARTLFRAETEHDDSPGIILSNINRSLHPDLEQAEMFITFLSARLDVTSGRLTYANAGHTEALWCQGHHACARLSSTGLPVGIFADTVVEEEMINLRPGDSLVFYSDGVTEAANSENDLFGIERLTDLLIEHSRASAPALRDAIVQAVESFRSGSPRSDDLTLVVLKARPRAVAFSYPGELEHLNAATGFIREAVLAYGETFASQMELAASEIITNVMRYAYRELSGDVDGEITLLPDRVRLDLYDHGASFDPAAVPDPDLENSQEGGYGLYIVRQIMDEVTYTPDTPNGNHWRLVHSGGNPPPVYAL
jgi:serine phosphatase RsbU (regulator of sigma subunit)/anti-sigma regulatory factor (Ser/Thr protein kinase)